MKTLIILLIYLNLPIVIFAQYEGGSGRQEALSSTSILQLNDGQTPVTSQLVIVQQPPSTMELIQQFNLKLEYRTANGQLAFFETGNVSLTFQTNPSGATLGGTTTLAATAGVVQFTGLSVDKLGTGYELLASGASSTSAVSNAFTYFSVGIGGSGRQEAMADGPAIGTLSGQVFWVGGLGAIPTDWNDPLNWFPNTAVPGNSDRLAMEPNNNGHNPILDQDRTIYSMNFNGADKKLELGNHTLTLTADASGVNSNNYFKTTGTGQLIKSISADSTFTFPVGNNVFNPVTITNKTGATDDFSVRVLDGVRNRGLSGNSVNMERVNVTWDISKASGNSNAVDGVDLEFFWETSHEVGGISGGGFNTASMNYYNSITDEWEIATTGTSHYTTGAQSLLHTGYKGTFSPFAIGGNDLTPLPVTYAFFDAIPYQQKPPVSKLQWQTIYEFNNSHFEIEWSVGANKWEKIGEVLSKGNSFSAQDYSFIHNTPSQFNTYRLKQIDLDGNVTYSINRTVLFDFSEPIPYTRLYPNPSTDEFVLQLFGAQKATYYVYDALGNLIDTGICQGEKIFSGLAGGVYQIKVQMGDKIDVKRVIIAK